MGLICKISRLGDVVLGIGVLLVANVHEFLHRYIISVEKISELLLAADVEDCIVRFAHNGGSVVTCSEDVFVTQELTFGLHCHLYHLSRRFVITLGVNLGILLEASFGSKHRSYLLRRMLFGSLLGHHLIGSEYFKVTVTYQVNMRGRSTLLVYNLIHVVRTLRKRQDHPLLQIRMGPVRKEVKS